MRVKRRVHGEERTTKLTVPANVRRELELEHGDRATISLEGHETEVRIGSRGYVTIPQALAEEVGIDPYDEITFDIENC